MVSRAMVIGRTAFSEQEIPESTGIISTKDHEISSTGFDTDRCVTAQKKLSLTPKMESGATTRDLVVRVEAES